MHVIHRSAGSRIFSSSYLPIAVTRYLRSASDFRLVCRAYMLSLVAAMGTLVLNSGWQVELWGLPPLLWRTFAADIVGTLVIYAFRFVFFVAWFPFASEWPF